MILAEQGRGGGLYLDPGSVQATARLLVAEVFALIIDVSSMRAAGTLPFSSIADAGLAKIEKALPSDKLRDLRRLSDCLCVRPLAPQVETANMGEMETALLPAFGPRGSRLRSSQRLPSVPLQIHPAMVS